MFLKRWYNAILDYFFPDRGVEVFKPGEDMFIHLPNGKKVLGTELNDQFAVQQVVKIGNKYFARRDIGDGNGMIRDMYPFDFGEEEEEEAPAAVENKELDDYRIAQIAQDGRDSLRY